VLIITANGVADQGLKFDYNESDSEKSRSVQAGLSEEYNQPKLEQHPLFLTSNPVSCLLRDSRSQLMAPTTANEALLKCLGSS
jgi:hypothetical protein